jgi:hypothetical protein
MLLCRLRSFVKVNVDVWNVDVKPRLDGRGLSVGDHKYSSGTTEAMPIAKMRILHMMSFFSIMVFPPLG